MKGNWPLVTIGMPVFNGMAYLRTAIESLLAQDYPNLELVIFDNASDDGTSEYCQALAKVHSHVRYTRNPKNVGPLANFELVLSAARGEWFMWAAHDDKWSPQFVSTLADSLLTRGDAVLATPTVLHMGGDGALLSDPPDRPAPGGKNLANLKRLYDDHAASWIYGLWRTSWMRRHIDEIRKYPVWGGDVLWLADICLRFPVVGNQDAVIFKRLRRSRLAPQTAREAVVFWFAMFWHTSHIAMARTQGWQQRMYALGLSWRYVYRLCIRRSNLLRTTWRVVRMLALAGLTGLGVAIIRAARRLLGKLQPARVA